nr:piggyBac transposable element-derived protein 4-like [Vanessa tameamea]
MTCLKWHDKRDIFMLSTCHNHEMQLSGGFRPIMKPKMVLTYNNGKKGIDLADQLASYNSPVRKTCIWYKKIAADILSIGVVNAIILHNELNPTKKFRLLAGHEYIIKKILTIGALAVPATGPSISNGFIA